MPLETTTITKTKTGTAMKTLLAVTVAIASLSAMTAFGFMAIKGIRGFLRPAFKMLPDLIVEDLSYNQYSGAYKLLIKNQGKAPTDRNFYVYPIIYFSDGYGTGRPIDVVQPLNPGESRIISEEYDLGWIYHKRAEHGDISRLRGYADNSKVILESNERNNILDRNANDSPRLKVEVGEPIESTQHTAGSSNVPIISYNLTALNESIEIYEFKIGARGIGGSGYNMDDIYRVKPYLDGVQVGNPEGYVFLNGRSGAQLYGNWPTIVIPRNTTSTFELRVDFADKTTVHDGMSFEIGLGDMFGGSNQWGPDGESAPGNYYIKAWGYLSQEPVPQDTIDDVGDGTGNVVGSHIQYLYDGFLTVTLNSSSPSGMAVAGGLKEVLRLDLTATGDDITINDIEFVTNGNCQPTGTGGAYLKSDDATVTYLAFPSPTVWLAEDNFSVNDSLDGTWYNPLVIAADTTKTIKLLGDTTGCRTNEILQINITGALDTSAGVEWMNNSSHNVDSNLSRYLPVNGGVLVY